MSHDPSTNTTPAAPSNFLRGIIDADTAEYRWIDFDLKQDVSDFDLWSIGNIISYALAKGIITFSAVLKNTEYPESIRASLVAEDS